MRIRLVYSILGFGLAISLSAPARAEAPSVPPTAQSLDSFQGQSSIVIPVNGLDSMQSLDINPAAGSGVVSRQPVVEAIPTPSAFEGGLFVMVVILALRTFLKVRAA